MISKLTTIVLGAGASKPYGFPLGPELRHQLVTLTLQPNSPLWAQPIYAQFEPAQLHGLREALSRSWASSIDAFLSSRPDLAAVGKAAIFVTLAPCEDERRLFEAEPHHDWFRHLWRFLHTPTRDEFTLNRIRFITFNYDRSLEHALTVGLRHAYALPLPEAFKMLPPILHVYGVLGNYAPVTTNNPLDRGYGAQVDPAHLRALADTITLMPEARDRPVGRPLSTRINDDLHAVRLQHLLADSARLIFMGFSYDPDNLAQLNLLNRGSDPNWLPPACNVYCSAMGLQKSELNSLNHYFRWYRAQNRFEIGDPAADSLAFLRQELDFGRE